MTESELRALPRAIFEHFHSISDDAFKNNADVIDAVQRKEKADAGHRQIAEDGVKLRTRRVRIENLREDLMEHRRELQSTRLQVVADALVNDDGITSVPDDEQRRKLEQLDVAIEAVPIALAKIDEQLRELNRRIHSAAEDVTAAEESLRGLIDSLKLAEARQLAS